MGRNAPGAAGAAAGLAGVAEGELEVETAAVGADGGVGIGVGGVCASTTDKVKTLKHVSIHAKKWNECFLKRVIGHPKKDKPKQLRSF
jgi:hypothetical protein